MNKNFTRAEAACIAKNIIALVTELTELLKDDFPDDYRKSIIQRAESMHNSIIANKQYKYVTDKMSAWLVNTWNGLRRWDHEGMLNEDMLKGVDDVVLWLHKKDEEDEEGKENEGGKEGEENDDNNTASVDAVNTVDNTTAGVDAVNTVDSGNNSVQQGRKSTSEYEHEGKKYDTLRELHVLIQERIDNVVDTVKREKIKLVGINDIKYGKLVRILSLTKSLRTTTLINAAYLTGMIAGINDIAAEMDKLIDIIKNKV